MTIPLNEKYQLILEGKNWFYTLKNGMYVSDKQYRAASNLAVKLKLVRNCTCDITKLYMYGGMFIGCKHRHTLTKYGESLARLLQ